MSFLFLLLFGLIAAQARDELRQGLTFHASFDVAYVAELSADAPDCVVRVGRTLQPATDGPDLARVPDGRFGAALRFARKSSVRPEFAASKALGSAPTLIATWPRAIATRCKSSAMTPKMALSFSSGPKTITRVISALLSARFITSGTPRRSAGKRSPMRKGRWLSWSTPHLLAPAGRTLYLYLNI